MACARTLEPRAHEEHDDQNSQAQPVQVLRLENSNEQVGNVGRVERETFVTTGEFPRVLADQHGAGLGKCEGHHGERDSGHPQAQRTNRGGHENADYEGQHDRRQQFKAEMPKRNAEPVCADGEVQGVPEREQPGNTENQVIAERKGSDEHAEREELKRPRRVRRAGKHPRNGEVEHRKDGKEHDEHPGETPPDSRFPEEPDCALHA